MPSGPFHGEGPGTSAIGSISCEWEQRGGCSTTGSVSGDRKRGKAPVPLGPFHGREPRGERGGCSASGHISEDGERAKGREGWLQCLWTHFRGWGESQGERGVVAVPLDPFQGMGRQPRGGCSATEWGEQHGYSPSESMLFGERFDSLH